MKPSSAKSCPSCGERYDADVLFCPRDGTPLASSRRGSAFGADARDPYLGLLLDGQIHIRHLIGIGSMGRVYRAFQAGIERDVAVKILHRELSSNAELVSRFHREARIASRLVHPNVVQVLMTGSVPTTVDPRIGGELYLVMEHLDGISLLSALAAAGAGGDSEALPLPRALHIILQVCDAVGEAHAQGIVHRDLKPENIMLVRRGEDPDYVKVLDFGIARLDWADKAMATQAGLIFGTAKYISPEGAEGKPVGPPADVYSIATILYQCLAGRAPFEGDSPVALLVQHTHTPPADLRSIARSNYVPAPIAEVVMQNLAKKPSERAPDARALGRDLALAVRASGLDPDEIAAQSGLLRSSAVMKLASKSRTRSLDLSPALASQIGGIAAPTLESARRSDLDPRPPEACAERGGASPSQPSGAAERGSFEGAAERAASGSAAPAWPPARSGATVIDRPSHGALPPSPTLVDPGDDLAAEARAPWSSARRGSAPAGPSQTAIGLDPAHDAAPAPSTMQGLESTARPLPRRAVIARATAILTLAGAVGLVVLLGGRHLGAFGGSAARDSLERHIERARDCMNRHAWDTPPGENVKEIVAQALARWPRDARLSNLRRESAERIVADALGRKYAGDRAGAIHLAKLALELHPELTTAQHFVAELSSSQEGAGAPPLEVAPQPSGPPAQGLAGKASSRQPPPRKAAPTGNRAASPGQPASPAPPASPPASTEAGRPTGKTSAPSPPATAAPAPSPSPSPVLPPPPPPLPTDAAAPLPPVTGPWL